MTYAKEREMSTLHTLKRLVQKAVIKAERQRKVDATIKELSRLSDLELNDIGIARGNIESIARGADRA
jgi:uncharacterized protein YjiS (DUF1127 family)